jgi:hypothetical protein
MRLESLRVELRPRSPWEAVELGTALVRRNAAAIWIPWLLLVAPVFVAVNLAALAVDRIWLAWLAMWWLKPLFDRIVLFVLSRAVFGETPTTRQTLAAQRSWGWHAMRGHLSWRRISLARALALPVDLLEGANAGRLRERRKVLGDAVRGQGMLLTVVCLLFVLALSLSMLSLALLFVPWEFLPESARATWSLLTVQPPPWAQFVLHAVAWIATSAIEPFYVGAGFGLYLNRRTRIEAWDVEIALRRMRTRLATTATALVLAVGAVSMLPLPSQAAPRANAVQDAARLDDVFGDARVDDPGFDKAVERAYRDPLLRPKRKQSHWQARERGRRAPPALSFPALAKAIAFIGEFGLWLLLLALLALLAATSKRWLPWLRGGPVARQSPAPAEVAEATLPDVLPEDIVAAARRRWREGRPRRALALVYRASVEAMAARAALTLVPGATESECLRASRRLPDPQDRDAFARVVRVWQYAAYAQQLPDQGEFDGLLDTLAQRFGWAR